MDRPEPYAGGCACGAVRYEITGQPLAQVHCQCRDCQRKSGTGHGSYLAFLRENLAITGEVRGWDLVADNGQAKTRGFCPICGAPVSLTFPARPEVFVVHAGSLDDPGRFRPEALTYAVRGHAWDAIDPALTRFERMPPSG